MLCTGICSTMYAYLYTGIYMYRGQRQIQPCTQYHVQYVLYLRIIYLLAESLVDQVDTKTRAGRSHNLHVRTTEWLHRTVCGADGKSSRHSTVHTISTLCIMYCTCVHSKHCHVGDLVPWERNAKARRASDSAYRRSSLSLWGRDFFPLLL